LHPINPDWYSQELVQTFAIRRYPLLNEGGQVLNQNLGVGYCALGRVYHSSRQSAFGLGVNAPQADAKHKTAAGDAADLDWDNLPHADPST
jgi:hypothetical protein